MNDQAIRDAIVFYASFDDAVAGDRGKGGLSASTRFDHPSEKGAFVVEPGFDEKIFRIARGRGIQGGALEAVDVLPRRGRIFFPGKGNLPYKPGGWNGSVSFWMNTDPNRLLKTPFCDPIQITEKGANNGGLWIDFPDVKPRDLRLGAFPAAKPGQEPMSESHSDAPLVVVKDIGYQADQWHHVAFTFSRFDTGEANAEAMLYLDGKPMGKLEKRNLAMNWNLDKTGIYVAVNFVGLLDELAIFDRALSPQEIVRLHTEAGLLASAKTAR